MRLYVGKYVDVNWIGPDIIEGDVKTRIEEFVDEAVHEAIAACMMCESAIERMFMVELRLLALRRYEPGRFYIIPQHETSTFRKLYRIDFLLSELHPEEPDFVTCAKLGVECDGRDDHTSADDIQYDKQRDRAILAQGIPVVRFTGRELIYDPRGCAEEALLVYESLLHKVPVVAMEG